MSVSKKKSIIPLIGLLAVVFLILLYYIFDPALSRFFPSCPFHYLTGYDCPGCGSQRAIHHLLNFDIVKAFHQNPLFVISIPYIILGLYLEYMNGKERLPQLYRVLFGRKAIFIILIIVILFWIGRNVL